jgi:hypothetical protein
VSDGSGINDTGGISAKMVDSIGDSGVQEGQPSAPPSAAYDYGTLPVDVHNHNGCADCKKQIGILRSALIVLALVLGALAMIYLAQRRANGHKHGNEEPTPTD